MNVVLPIHEARGASQFNTAVVINRRGNVVGSYSKIFPVFGKLGQTVPPTEANGGEVAPPDSVTPSAEGVRAFDLDIGRVVVLICYDINFPELWQQADALGADLVVWPSAMATPDPTSYGYASIHRSFDIVAVGYPADFIGRDGQAIRSTADPRLPFLRLATVDIDRTFAHWDYNGPKIDAMRRAHPSVEIDIAGPPHFLLRSADNHTSVRKLCAEFGIETLRSYVHRARRGVNLVRHTEAS